MKTWHSFLSGGTFSAQVLTAFLLFFRDRIELPAWVQVAGRLHPALLHLPIGGLLLLGIFWMFRRQFEAESRSKILSVLLHVTAFSAALTALFGFFLSREGGYEGDTLTWHQWSGLAVSWLSYAMLLLPPVADRPFRNVLFGLLLTSATGGVLVSGHFGATLTHGEGYVWQPLQPEKTDAPVTVSDTVSLFEAVVKPVLRGKCFSCHNEEKSKGKLVLSTREGMLRGGENGPAWVAGDTSNSLILKYIHLPEDDKKHMPPSGKPQLTPREIALLQAWIAAGADLDKPLRDYPETDTLRRLAAMFMQPVRTAAVYTFAAASASTIRELNTPFCSVTSIADGSPALQASFFVRQKFDRDRLAALAAVKNQLVSLNLSNMPVTDDDLASLAVFQNLEKLNLNRTDISGKSIEQLAKLSKLNSLSIAGTRIDKTAIKALARIPALREIFVWNTALAANADVLPLELPNVRVIAGYTPDSTEILKLNPPILKNENAVLADGETVVLSHPLPGVNIRYTLDGSVPDSVRSPVYKGPIVANGFAQLRAIAEKPGWYSSDATEFMFFKKGIPVSRVELLTPPNEQYKAAGSKALFDGKKGNANDFREPVWLGYREQPFMALVHLDKPAPVVGHISISYARNITSYIMPPTDIEIWGGPDSQHLQRIATKRPVQPTKLNPINIIDGIQISLPAGAAHACYKIIVRPVTKLPAWHPGKGDRGWVFIDEIFFYP